jgi:hypothetical protein
MVFDRELSYSLLGVHVYGIWSLIGS